MIERDNACTGAVPGKRDRLGTGAAAHLQNHAAWGIRSVGMKQVQHGAGLRLQALGLVFMIAVDVLLLAVRHTSFESAPGPDVFIHVLSENVERYVAAEYHRVVERLEVEACA